MARRASRSRDEGIQKRILSFGALILFALHYTGGIPVATARDRIVTVLVAGDVASSCSYRFPWGSLLNNGAEDTARLLDQLNGTILAVGDLAYPKGRAEDFRNCFEPTWGRHKARTWPVPGNHEYRSKGAAPYFDYWRERLGHRDPKFYSFDLGAWHILALNSEIDSGRYSEQAQWLRANLMATQRRCILAYWHRPRYSSGYHGGYASVQGLFETLYEFGVSLLVSAHEHDYERFAPQDPWQRLERQRGIRQFVVGTGGANLRSRGKPAANSEVFHHSSHGVLKLDLGEHNYTWRFIPVGGKSFHDTGSAPCVRRPKI